MPSQETLFTEFFSKATGIFKKDFLNQPINPETSPIGLSLQGNGVHWIDPIASVVPEKSHLEKYPKMEFGGGRNFVLIIPGRSGSS